MPFEESFFEVLRALQHNPNINQRALATRLGMSLGKTNYCLKALISKGLVKVQNFRNSDNKTAYAYLLTSAGIAEKAALTTHFLKAKISEYEALNSEIQQLKDELALEHHHAANSLRPYAQN